MMSRLALAASIPVALGAGHTGHGEITKVAGTSTGAGAQGVGFGEFNWVCDTTGENPLAYVEISVDQLMGKFGSNFFELGKGEASTVFPAGCEPLQYGEFFSPGGFAGHSPWDGRYLSQAWTPTETPGQYEWSGDVDESFKHGGYEKPHIDLTFGVIPLEERDAVTSTCTGCPGDWAGALKCCVHPELVDFDEETAKFFHWPPTDHVKGLGGYYNSPVPEWGNHAGVGRGTHMLEDTDLSAIDKVTCGENPNAEAWEALKGSDYYLPDRANPDVCWQKCAVQAESIYLFGAFVDYGCSIGGWYDGLGTSLMIHDYHVLGYEIQFSIDAIFHGIYSQTLPNPYFRPYPIFEHYEQPGHYPIQLFVEVTDDGMVKAGVVLSHSKQPGCPLCCTSDTYPPYCADESITRRGRNLLFGHTGEVTDCSGCDYRTLP